MYVSFVDADIEGFDLDMSEIEESFVRGSGPGGQHRNTSDTDVRLVHRPTGVTVTIQGRSQWKNRQEAFEVMKQRLSEHYHEQAHVESVRSKNADRESGKNFNWCDWRDEVVNHHTKKKTSMKKALKGNLDALIS